MSAITDSARNRECLLKLPGVCCGDPEKTVWAHSNRYADGKGRSLKCPDHMGCYACYFCHMVYDRQFSRPAGLSLAYVESAFTRAMKQSQSILIRLGLWDGKSTPEKRPKVHKSKKIPVTGLSSLQRMALGLSGKT